VFTARYRLGLYIWFYVLPHNVFMCFVWTSEKTAISSLYSINWLVFITEKECVYCAVRAVSISIMRVKHVTFELSHLCGAAVFSTLNKTNWSLSTCARGEVFTNSAGIIARCRSHSATAEDSGLLGCYMLRLSVSSSRRFLDCLTLKIRALRSFETSGIIRSTTLYHIPEDSSLQHFRQSMYNLTMLRVLVTFIPPRLFLLVTSGSVSIIWTTRSTLQHKYHY
jgi:hypothetical protein